MANAFHQYPFTSTLHEESTKISFNVLTVVLTAIFFFLVLAWFNFALAVYGTLTTTDKNHIDQTLSTLGFAILWTIISFGIYYVISPNTAESNEYEHPLLRGEGGQSSNILGSIDMTVV